MDTDREERECLTIKIKRLRTALRTAADPAAARRIDGALRNTEETLARLLETLAVAN
jgi:hypothetical protein